MALSTPLFRQQYVSLQAEKAAGLINTGAANEAKNHDAGAVKSDLERYELKSAAMIVNTKEPCFVTNYPEWTLRCTVRKSLAKAPSYFYLNLSGHNCIAILFLMSHMQGAEWWNIYIFFLVGVVTRSSARAWQNEGKKPKRLGKGKLLPKQKNPPWKTSLRNWPTLARAQPKSVSEEQTKKGLTLEVGVGEKAG